MKTSRRAERSTKDRKAQLKAVRDWAAATGIDCPSLGRIPARVTQAYEQAHRAEPRTGNTGGTDG